MFKMVKTLTAWWPVKVYEPNPEVPGTFIDYDFEIEFEILDRDELKKQHDARSAVFDDAEKDDSPRKMELVQERLDALELETFQRVVRNWRGIVGEDDKPFLFSNENLLTAVKRTHVREGINVAYAEAVDSGKARLGN